MLGVSLGCFGDLILLEKLSLKTRRGQNFCILLSTTLKQPQVDFESHKDISNRFK
jgi:hypothetical protein